MSASLTNGKAADPQSENRRPRDGAQFGLLGLIWGLSFLLIKLAERSFAPLQVSCGRVVVGAFALIAVAGVRRQRLPQSWRTWAHLMVAGLLLNALPFTLFAYGEQHVSSVLAGIWNATTPLFALPVAVLVIGDERATRRRLAGLLIGFAGVLIVLGVWGGLSGGSLVGDLLCLGAAASYGLGFPYARRYLTGREDSPLGLAAAQLICASLQLAVLTVLVTRPPSDAGAQAIFAVLALGALGTGLAYVLNYALIGSIGATRAATVAYVIPIFSTIAGVAFLSEPLRANQPLGALIVLLGAAISQGRLQKPRAGPPGGKVAHKQRVFQ